MKSKLFFLVSLLAVAGCSKKNDPGTSLVKSSTNCELTGLAAQNFGYSISYNKAGLPDSVHITWFDVTSLSVIQYDGQNQLSGILDPGQHTVFQPGTNGKPSVASLYYRKKNGDDSTLFSTRTFIYQDSLCSKEIYDPHDYDTFEYDAKGNLSRIYSTSPAGTFLAEHDYNYDDKIDPFFNFPFTVEINAGAGTTPTSITLEYHPIPHRHNLQTQVNNYSSTDSTVTNYVYSYDNGGYTVGATGVTYVYTCK